MNEEVKVCPFCGKPPQGNNWHTYGRNPKDEIKYFCATVGCPNALHKVMTKEEWNTRPIEDALRAELADMTADRDSEKRWADQYARERDQAQAEVERLREIIREAEWDDMIMVNNRSYLFAPACPICEIEKGSKHDIDCPFYQWEGGSHE